MNLKQKGTNLVNFSPQKEGSHPLSWRSSEIRKLKRLAHSIPKTRRSLLWSIAEPIWRNWKTEKSISKRNNENQLFYLKTSDGLKNHSKIMNDHSVRLGMTCGQVPQAIVGYSYRNYCYRFLLGYSTLKMVLQMIT